MPTFSIFAKKNITPQGSIKLILKICAAFFFFNLLVFVPSFFNNRIAATRIGKGTYEGRYKGVNRVGYQECGSTPGYGLRLSREVARESRYMQDYFFGIFNSVK